MTVSRRRFLTFSTAMGAASAVPFTFAASGSPLTSKTDASSQWKPRDLKTKPNIVVVVLDDVGFADFGCYGSEGLTPAIDGLAADGVRFNNFHVTALCAPTRACLLTGRNAHAVGVGNIAEWGRLNHPSYLGWIRPDAATIAEMLRPHGYSTMAAGKWHLSSIPDQNASGPFDHWPTGRGFDRWYGCHGNAIDHFHPELFENNVQVHPDKSGGYHLSEDLVTRLSTYVKDHISATPSNPFFAYLAFGACHFPFHAPQSYLDDFRGRYDAGWDVLRAERFERQKELGIIPPDTRLSERGPTVTPWRELNTDTQNVAKRMQEAYAAFLRHTDDQLARLVSFLRAEGQLDNTILMVMSDNGATAGSAPQHGMLDVRRVSYQEPESLEFLASNLNLIGTENSQCMYGPGWGQAGNTPLKWFKSNTFGGGTRSPLVVHWPNGGLGSGTILPQYHHAIDVLPALLEMANVPVPGEVDGVPQVPVQGTSFAYAIDNPDAETTKAVQYFETLGDRAIWADGWKAVVRHHGSGNFEDDVWELYHLDNDFSETHNLAEHETGKLMSLVSLWDREADRYGILPMANNTLELYAKIVPEPQSRYVFYPGMTRLDRLSAPDIYAFDSDMKAYIEKIDGVVEGVLLASGDGGAGYEWFVDGGQIVFSYVYTREQRISVRSERKVSSDAQTLGVSIRKIDQASAQITLLIDDDEVASGVLPKMWPIYAPNAGLRCGENTGAPVSGQYRGSFPFSQPLQRIIVDIDL
jgi:arylsulfatase A-like enzyme